MTKSTRKKPRKRPRCTKCHEQFPQQGRERRCYSCKVISPMWNSSEGHALFNHVKNTGYLECIAGVRLVDLFDLHKRCKSYNQVNYNHESKRWGRVLDNELCHLQPAKMVNGMVGQLSPSNLVIAPAAINRRLGSTHFHNVGVSVAATTPIPLDDAELKREIVKVADTAGIDDYKFSPKGGCPPKYSFHNSTDDTYSTVLKAEAVRLNAEIDSSLSVLNGFLDLLRGMHSTDIPFTLDRDEILYCNVGEEKAYQTKLWFNLYQHRGFEGASTGSLGHGSTYSANDEGDWDDEELV